VSKALARIRQIVAVDTRGGSPANARIYAFYTFSDCSRTVGVMSVMRGFGSRNASVDVLSEITFPPFASMAT
jgi:hypothetical protein